MKKHFLFTAALFAALSLGFVSCENPDDDKFGNSIEQSDDDKSGNSTEPSDDDKFGNSTEPSDDNETPDAPDSGDDDTETPVSCFTPAAFSVSSTKQVYFSSANLQYHPKNDEWRFAPSQLDYVGDGNENISSTYNGWLDLFAWGTGSNPTSTSSNSTFVDWGTNQIGSDAPNTWRTLTSDEWDYVIFDRPSASSLRGVARVNGVNGLILLPDSWTCPAGIIFKSGFYDERGAYYYAAYQTFTADQWSKMEAAGAVFLPAAGNLDTSYAINVRYGGYYWSDTEGSGDYDYAYYLRFYSDEASMLYSYRGCGQSVRLVKDL